MSTAILSGADNGQPPPAYFGARVALVYSAYFFTISIYVAFFPYWLQTRGLSAAEISLVLAAPLVVRVLTSGQIAAYADRARDRADVIIVLCCLAAIFMAMYEFAAGLTAILAVTVLFSAANNPVAPIVDSIALSGVRRFGSDYGRIRLWGSLVFVIATLAGGWAVARGSNAEIVVHMLAASAIATAFISLLTPRIGARRQPLGAVPEGRWAMLRDRRLLPVLIANALIASSHAMLFAFATIYWLSAGYSGTAVGVLWATGTIAEIVLFRFSRRVHKHVPAYTMMMAGGIGAAVRFGLMPLEPSFAGLLVLQTMHCLSFGAAHLGFMRIIADTVPERRMGAVNGAAFVIGGAFMGLAMLASGPLYTRFGVGAFPAMSALAALGVMAVVLARRAQPQRLGEGG